MPSRSDEAAKGASHRGEIFATFLKLGLTSFGGPVAHLGYFRDELVTRRRWLSDAAYADLVALCQFLPGPASSQVGFALGLLRGGMSGALLAWAAFTLPSVLLLLLFAYSAATFGGPLGQGLLHGLKLVAVAVVAQAVWGMARNLCPDRERAGIAVGAVMLVVFLPTTFGQISAIALGGLLGLWRCRGIQTPTGGQLPLKLSATTARRALIGFFVLLLALPPLTLALDSQALGLFEAFYRAGALVFGGGHVVLPMLESSMVETGRISADSFLAGYAMAQAVPGPLFTFAAYLGALVQPGILGVVLALTGIFLPGFLLLVGILPHWDALRRKSLAQAAMAGANAAVVGVLAAALYDPVWTSSIVSAPDFALALAGFVLLTLWQLSPWKLVVLGAGAGVALTLL